MVLHIQGCVKHALKEDAAGIFNKPSRQPSLIRALQVVAAETSHQRHHGVGGVRRLAVEISPRIEMQRNHRFLQNGKGQSGWRAASTAIRLAVQPPGIAAADQCRGPECTQFIL
jgi:hypothetical protein